MIKTRTVLLISIGLVIALAGCQSLSSEPDILREIPLPTPEPTVNVVPVALPDPVNGAAFYTEHCVMCHGPAGQGDGEMVMDGRLQNAPPDFSDPATVSGKTPAEYMTAITDGNVLAGMPPFSSYTEQERWDAAAYVYTGHIAPDVLTLGAAVYEENCVRCHGATGMGDGAEAPAIMPDLSSAVYWASTSDATLDSAIRRGASQAMPAFAGILTEDELTAVTAYTRTLALDQVVSFETGTTTSVADDSAAGEAPAATEAPDEAALQPTDESPAAEATITPAPDDANPDATDAVAEADTDTEAGLPDTLVVTGVVTNGTADGAVPADAVVTLHMFDPPEFNETTLETTLQEDGTYTFEAVPYVSERAFLLSFQHDGVFFSSTVYTLDDPTVSTIDTSIEIFEITNDPAVITISAGVMRVTFSRFGMEVVEVLSVTNDSDQLFLTDEHLNENQRIALSFPLPPGAGGVGFEPGMEDTRFVVSEDGTTVIDTQPTRPGTQQIFVSYLIPYEDGAIIEQEFNYPFVGPFHLLLSSSQVSVTDGPFEGGAESVDMGGDVFEALVAEMELPADGVLSFTLVGAPNLDSPSAAPTNTASGGGLPTAAVIALVAGLVLVGVGGFMFLLRQGDDPTQREIDDLLEQIAELDDQHDQGMLNHDYYQRKRAELKAQLTELMDAREDEA